MEGEDKEIIDPQEEKQGSHAVKLNLNGMPERIVQPPPPLTPAAAVAEEEEKGNHTCKECGKNFDSGKSLGGHISTAHVQSKKDHILKKLKSNSESDHKSLGKYCVLCGKEFTSSKALFEHMRCHPEREWMGMDPPESGNVAAAAVPVADIASSLKGWCATDKRGRPEISKPVPAPATAVKDKNMISFLDKLMTFVEDESEKESKEVEDEESSSLVGNQFKKRKVEDASDVADEKNTNQKAEAESTAEAEAESKAEVELQSTTVKETGHYGPSSRRSFICTTCNRRFKTHQALGGHRSSHNKFKLNIINTVDTTTPNENNNEVSKKPPGSYVCNICNTTFSNGQAFGWHKRSHREEEKKKNVGGRFEIDLNKLPDEYDEDGGVQL